MWCLVAKQIYPIIVQPMIAIVIVWLCAFVIVGFLSKFAHTLDIFKVLFDIMSRSISDEQVWVS